MRERVPIHHHRTGQLLLHLKSEVGLWLGKGFQEGRGNVSFPCWFCHRLSNTICRFSKYQKNLHMWNTEDHGQQYLDHITYQSSKTGSAWNLEFLSYVWMCCCLNQGGRAANFVVSHSCSCSIKHHFAPFKVFPYPPGSVLGRKLGRKAEVWPTIRKENVVI